MNWLFFRSKSRKPRSLDGNSELGVLKRAKAQKVIFYYAGEEGSFLDDVDVTLFENGIVHLTSNEEETTTHLRNCEIIWHHQKLEDLRKPFRLIRMKDSPDLRPEDPSPTL